MVAYEPVLHVKAERELNALPSEDKDRLTSLIKDVAAEREPTTHPRARHLEGQRGLFRLREGSVRAIATLCKPNIIILKVGKRDSVYEKIDETIESRSAGIGAEV